MNLVIDTVKKINNDTQNVQPMTSLNVYHFYLIYRQCD